MKKGDFLYRGLNTQEFADYERTGYVAPDGRSVHERQGKGVSFFESREQAVLHAGPEGHLVKIPKNLQGLNGLGAGGEATMVRLGDSMLHPTPVHKSKVSGVEQLARSEYETTVHDLIKRGHVPIQEEGRILYGKEGEAKIFNIDTGPNGDTRHQGEVKAVGGKGHQWFEPRNIVPVEKADDIILKSVERSLHPPDSSFYPDPNAPKKEPARFKVGDHIGHYTESSGWLSREAKEISQVLEKDGKYYYATSGGGVTPDINAKSMEELLSWQNDVYSTAEKPLPKGYEHLQPKVDAFQKDLPARQAANAKKNEEELRKMQEARKSIEQREAQGVNRFVRNVEDLVSENIETDGIRSLDHFKKDVDYILKEQLDNPNHGLSPDEVKDVKGHIERIKGIGPELYHPDARSTGFKGVVSTFDELNPMEARKKISEMQGAAREEIAKKEAVRAASQEASKTASNIAGNKPLDQNPNQPQQKAEQKAEQREAKKEKLDGNAHETAAKTATERKSNIGPVHAGDQGLKQTVGKGTVVDASSHNPLRSPNMVRLGGAMGAISGLIHSSQNDKGLGASILEVGMGGAVGAGAGYAIDYVTKNHGNQINEFLARGNDATVGGVTASSSQQNIESRFKHSETVRKYGGATMKGIVGLVAVSSALSIKNNLDKDKQVERQKAAQELKLKADTRKDRESMREMFGYQQQNNMGQLVLDMWDDRIGHHLMGNNKFK